MSKIAESLGMSRRRFLAMSAVSAGGLALAACGSDDDDKATPETSPSGGTQASAGSTQAGGTDTTGPGDTTASTGGGASPTGTLTIGMNSVVEGLTPFAIQGYVWSQMLGFVLYDPLIKKDEEGKLQPCLATEWDTSDPLKTVLKIREGVTFHDGTPLTAKDVAYSIAARSDEKLIASTAGRPIMTPTQWVSAEAVDDLTVEVVTTERVSSCSTRSRS
jgi:peptide/nickel transport system substrate-binding protein